MSLTFDVKGIKNWEEVCYDDTDSLRPITNALVFATMMAGICEITEENAADFYARLAVMERANGTYLLGPDPKQPLFITPEHVHDHIGLRTNASVDDSEEEWMARVLPNVLRDMRRHYKNETKEKV